MRFEWLPLFLFSALLVALLEAVRLPAALLLGPIAAALFFATRGCAMRVPHPLFLGAQGLIGCMISRAMPPHILGELLKDWPLLLAGVFSVIAASSVLGYLLARFKVMPGTTAVWGSTPGAASSMMLMGEAYGADIRLVAFMQYLRVLLVVIVASLVARIWVPHGVLPAATVWFPQVPLLPFAETLLVAASGLVLVRFVRIPAGPMLVPLALGMALEGMGVMVIFLPPWLLAVSYALLGWAIGLRFTREILAHAARALPKVAGSILCLILICGGFSALLTLFAGIDPLTAYLAMSPGGADSVAIIAASTKVDVPFVMAMQTGRFIAVLLTGPYIARFIAKKLAP